jgi:RNA polymerase sigma-70 factor (ECF subfamily)
MTPPDDQVFEALVHQGRRQAATVLAVSLDVEGTLARIKQRAADAHTTAVHGVRQEQRDFQLVGATLSRAFTGPVQLLHPPPVRNAATLRPDDGLREVPTEDTVETYSEASTDLAVIVADAVEGDRSAVDLLLGYIRPLVVRYCRARVGRQERSFASADDVAQEVCLTILTALASFRDQDRSFLAFVYGIAVHKVTDANQTAQRDRAAQVALSEESVVVTGPDQRAVQPADMSASMARLLEMIPVKQREILVLRVVVGLSAEETADAVGSTPGAVRVAQHRALARLRKAAGRMDLL